MVEEQFSLALTSNLLSAKNSVTPQGYYRSRLFITQFTNNDLVAAASPLLSLLERLCITPSLPDVAIIRTNIEHELNAFHSHLHAQSYPEELDLIAHYILSATIDEIIGKNYLRVHGSIAEFNAFTPTSRDNCGPETYFFTIVNYIKARPNQYLDLLELVYYCLIAGFEGEQHGKPDGRQTLDNLIEELYQLIQKYRVHKSHQLFHQRQETPITQSNTRPWLIGIILSLTLFISCYVISYLWIETKAKNIQFTKIVRAKPD